MKRYALFLLGVVAVIMFAPAAFAQGTTGEAVATNWVAITSGFAMAIASAAGGYAQQEPLVRLASNESPYPPLTEVREAIERALSTLNRYPDREAEALRADLARYGPRLLDLA